MAGNWRDIEASLSSRHKRLDPREVTTIVGMHCRDGIALFSDTTEVIEGDASVLGTKLDFTRKIYFINPNYAIGCAGDSKNITPFIVHLDQELRNRTEMLGDSELHSLLYNEIIPTFCAKERAIAEKMYGKEELRPIYLEGLFAARTKGHNQFALFKININVTRVGSSRSNDQTSVQPVIAGAVGTGGQIVEPVINQVMLIIDKKNYNFSSWSLKLASLFCMLLLLFASNSDARTGKRSAGAIIRGVDAPIGNTSRIIREHEFLKKGEIIWQQFILTALLEMPKFINSIPLDKLKSVIESFNIFTSDFTSSSSKTD